MKKIINDPHRVVTDMLKGMTAAHHSIEVLPGMQVIVRRNKPRNNKVGLVAGGGSGHEPAHGGFVGFGMLDAACLGDVFTSPAVDQMLAAIKAVDLGQGVLIIAKNYTGDNLNFDMAIELADLEGIHAEKVVVADDVATKREAGTTGRRGVAGTVFVHKLAGAKAETGATLAEVKAAALDAIDNIRSFGMAMDSCIVPAVGKPNFTIADGGMELGIGIHGEKGVSKEALCTAHELAGKLLDPILSDMPSYEGSEVAVMVNGMGATPLMELYILYGEIEPLLKQHGITVHRAYVGEYMTSLEMSGCSLTLLKLDSKRKALLDAPASTIAFTQI